jgi:spore maturation protein CgeB
VYEPEASWSATNLVREVGPQALEAFREAYPSLRVHTFALETSLERILDEADLVLVHEWTEPSIVARIGKHRLRLGHYVLLFHDTHHRALTQTADIEQLSLDGYDGVLTFGEALSERYRRAGWSRRVWTWHEAADVHVFRSMPAASDRRDLVWVGNWGDEERTEELHEFLFGPATTLGLTGHVYGVRYPEEGRAAVGEAGLLFGGHVPNHRVPEVFAAHRVTVHIPRRPYVRHLPGIPTIRVFEALACGIPLISAPWNDCEGLFREGEDYLVARTGTEMTRCLREVLADPERARALATSGRHRILARHTCAHRVDELLAIADRLQPAARAGVP